MMEGGALKSFGTNNGTNSRDLGLERCLIEYMTSICSVKAMKADLVAMGVATQLLQASTLGPQPTPHHHHSMGHSGLCSPSRTLLT
jgi:hypothetical protein